MSWGPTMRRRSETAVIVGAGMQGCATAIFLARAGWRVTLVEKNVAGRHASSVNAGGLRLLVRDWREYPLSEVALAHWANLQALDGAEAAARCEVRLGTSQIAVAFDEAELKWVEDRAEEMRRRKLGVEELLSIDEVRRLLPGISGSMLGGLISRRDGHANPAASARAFRDAASASGATIIEDCRVLGLDLTSSASWKIRTSTETLEADVVVNCAGAWGSRIAALAGEVLPEKIMAPSMMVTDRVRPFVEPVVIGIDRPLSFKQSAVGSLVIGGGILGEAAPDRDTSFTVMERMATAAAATIEAFPRLASISVLRTWTGLEAGTPDGIPIVGPSAQHPNLWHAFGFCGHGFLLAPAVGETVARSLLEGEAADVLSHFAPSRFADATAKPTLMAVR